MQWVKWTASVVAVMGLGACGGGGGSVSVDSTEIGGEKPASINSVPAAYQDQVRQAKTETLILDDDESRSVMHILGKVYRDQPEVKVDYSGLPNGLGDYALKGEHFFKKDVVDEYDGQRYRRGDNTVVEGVMRLYQQPYSVVYGVSLTRETLNGKLLPRSLPFDVEEVFGLATPAAKIDALDIKADYRGKAFTGDESGQLKYTVDFKARSGQGEITGLNKMGTVALTKGSIIDMGSFYNIEGGKGITAPATAKGLSAGATYALVFTGPNAEEVVGSVTNGGNDRSRAPIGFAGQR